MGIEPGQWKEVAGKLLPSRIQDPGAGYVILKTWNMNGFLPRIAKGPGQVLTVGGRPVTVAGPGGMNQVLWMREPNGFFVALEQPVPSPAAPGANCAPAASYYTGADAGFGASGALAAGAGAAGMVAPGSPGFGGASLLAEAGAVTGN